MLIGFLLKITAVFLVASSAFTNDEVGRIEQPNFEDEVTSIKVEEWKSREVISTLTDQQFIHRLMKSLQEAETRSTAFYDMKQPDYRLIFYHGEKKLWELGYYRNIVTLGIEGRYLSISNDIIYGVTLKFPIIRKSKY